MLRRLGGGGFCASLGALSSTRAFPSSEKTGSVFEASSIAGAQQFRQIHVPMQLKAFGGTFRDKKQYSPRGKLVALKELTSDLGDQVNDMTDSFSSMGLDSKVVAAVHILGAVVPSPIQQMAIEPILKHGQRNGAASVLLASPSGTGKTLAYLTGIYQSLVKDRDVYKVPTRELRPRAVIIAPTRELCDQIMHVCTAFETTTGLKAHHLRSMRRNTFNQGKMLREVMPDVLVTTPQGFYNQLYFKKLFLDDLRHVVYDDADILVEPEKHKHAGRLLKLFRARKNYKHLWPVQTQMIFSTTAVTSTIHRIAREWDMQPIVADSIHKIPAEVAHKFYLVSQQITKLDYTRYLLKKLGHRPIDWGAALDSGVPVEFDWAPTPGVPNSLASGGPQQQPTVGVEGEEPTVTGKEVMVRTPKDSSEIQESSGSRYKHTSLMFTDRSQPVKLRWEHLSSAAAPHYNPFVDGCDGAAHHKLRGRRVFIFFSSVQTLDKVFKLVTREGFRCTKLHAGLSFEKRDANYARFMTGQSNIMLCTDIFARGIDTELDVVINWDVPNKVGDYIARSGRVGRMGRRGMVCNLWSKSNEGMISAVRFLTKKQVSLEDVTNNPAHNERASHGQWSITKRNALARKFVDLISKNTIPANKEKHYLRHNATYRPLWQPDKVDKHFGINPDQNHNATDKVAYAATWARRELMARRKRFKGMQASAKWGTRTDERAVFGERDGFYPRTTSQDQDSPRHNDDPMPGPPTEAPPM